MSMIHSARGGYVAGLAVIEDLIAQSLESRATSQIPNIHALRAQLALASGDTATATDWAQEFELGTITAGYEILVPALLAARILLNSEQPEAQAKVEAILQEHQSFYESTNNKRFLIETLALRAMQCAATGDDKSAEPLLRRAVTMAKPGGFVRVFVDLGPDIIPLLNRLQLDEQQLKYVGTILAGFQGEVEEKQSDKPVGARIQDTAGLSEALSKREKEVLDLLALRLTNKEIGARLFIAPETVKRHAHNIFEKLNVSSRQAARAKAIGLGLVSE
jgi:LuxR family maltose regulon positive regulatory protein